MRVLAALVEYIIYFHLSLSDDGSEEYEMK